jgi:hypothetical protein
MSPRILYVRPPGVCALPVVRNGREVRFAAIYRAWLHQIGTVLLGLSCDGGSAVGRTRRAAACRRRAPRGGRRHEHAPRPLHLQPETEPARLAADA